MEPHHQTASVLQPGGIEFAFGTGDGSHSFTWSPPASASPPDNDHQTALNDRKRRRVHVNIVKQGVALLQLGSDITYDFSSTHAEAEKILAGVIAERDHLQRNLDIIKDDLRHTLGRYRAIVEKLDGTQGEDLEHAQQKVSHANLQRAKAEEEVKEVKAELDNLRDQAQVEKTNLVQEREELQKELDSATKSEMRYRDEVAQLKKDTESLGEEHKGCQVSHDKLQSDLLSALQASVGARAELSEAQKGLDESHDKYAKLVVEMRLLEEKNTAQVTRLGSERCEHLREKRETIEKQKKAEAEIKRLRDENYSLSSKFRGGTLEDELRMALEAELGN
ncbi:uncharacterized protein GLRG_00426 [Colletotrichum graminicola M1.001]|uniref:Uncharacterized protein n=1 Tax=Colletotrichum graminicola (strain M1.001 / M2 / FGSC 10212) TaxID=645133 RepID=E3Q2I1_COLGM|nr:uncharacterized protein GLRG_00426 [Colletotrichum graminicola M1.001]EFQ25282.1 hypothetical protein GLRG_00426 [Colletotrichum graminicola M1.001]